MDNLDKPYRKLSAREPQGIPYNYKDLSRLSSLTQDQVESTINNTTLVDGGSVVTVSLSDAIPQALGTASAGIGTSASRDDHVHSNTSLTTEATTRAAADTALTAADVVIQAQLDTLVDPTLTSWAWRNQGSSTAVTSGKTILLTMPHEGTDAVRLYKRGHPGAPCTFEAAFEIGFPMTLSYVGVGIIFNNTASGDKFIAFMEGPTTFNLMTFIANTGLSTWSTVTNTVAYPFNVQRLVWMKGYDDGTTLYFYTSVNGIDWVLMFSEARTVHTNTPDEIGIALIADHATQDAVARLKHFRVY